MSKLFVLSLACQDILSTIFVFLRVAPMMANQTLCIHYNSHHWHTSNGEKRKISFYKQYWKKYQPLLTSLIKSTNIKSINGKRLGECKSGNERVWEDGYMYVGGEEEEEENVCGGIECLKELGLTTAYNFRPLGDTRNCLTNNNL